MRGLLSRGWVARLSYIEKGGGEMEEGGRLTKAGDAGMAKRRLVRIGLTASHRHGYRLNYIMSRNPFR